MNDASFFQDGLGLNAVGVEADCIAVTTVTRTVCVTAVNYSTNTITLASGIARSSGDKVWLYSDSSGNRQLYGAAPNMGAMQQASSSTPSAPGAGGAAVSWDVRVWLDRMLAAWMPSYAN